MGVETAIGAGLMGAGSLAGAISGDRANARATKASNQRQDYLNNMGQNLMVAPGSSPYEGQINDLLSSLGFTPTQAPTINGSQIDLSSILPNLNVGNDSLTQMLRADPSTQMDPTATAFLKNTINSGGNPFDTSQLFGALGVTDKRNIDQQVNDLIASGTGGGLGERFGTSLAQKGVQLRTNALQDINTRNAGIQQSAYEAGQGRAMTAADSLNSVIQNLFNSRVNAASTLNSGLLQSAGLALQGAQANQNSENSAASQNAQNFLTTAGMNNAQQNATFAEQLQSILSAAGLGQNDRNYNAGIFQTLAGLPGTATTGASNIPGAGQDIGSLLLLLGQLGGQRSPTGTMVNNSGGARV